MAVRPVDVTCGVGSGGAQNFEITVSEAEHDASRRAQAGRIVRRVGIRDSVGALELPEASGHRGRSFRPLWSRSNGSPGGAFGLTDCVVFGWVRGLRGRTQPNTASWRGLFENKVPERSRQRGQHAVVQVLKAKAILPQLISACWPKRCRRLSGEGARREAPAKLPPGS